MLLSNIIHKGSTYILYIFIEFYVSFRKIRRLIFKINDILIHEIHEMTNEYVTRMSFIVTEIHISDHWIHLRRKFLFCRQFQMFFGTAIYLNGFLCRSLCRHVVVVNKKELKVWFKMKSYKTSFLIWATSWSNEIICAV